MTWGIAGIVGIGAVAALLFWPHKAPAGASVDEPSPQADLPRGIRNNNPGNIEDVGIKWRGRIGGDGRYVIFDTAVNGLRAMALEIYDSIERDGDNTIEALVTQWAPPTENQTRAYIESVSQQTGIAPTTELVYRRDVAKLMRAITRHENGIQPYSALQISDAIAAAGH